MSCQTLAWWSVKGEFSADKRNEVNPSSDSVEPNDSDGSELGALCGDGAGDGTGRTKWESLDEVCEGVSSVLGSGSDEAKLAGEADNVSGSALFVGRMGDCEGISANRWNTFSSSDSLRLDCIRSEFWDFIKLWMLTFWHWHMNLVHCRHRKIFWLRKSWENAVNRSLLHTIIKATKVWENE
jgi:hypothetical protein